ncbi:MAG: hypothetical protein ACTHOI_05500 [Sphingomicrobium sp.]
MKASFALAFAFLALSAPGRASDYLYVWGMETRDPSTSMPPASTMGRDFLAVFSVRLGSSDFGRLVAMLPVGTRAQMAHHTNYELPLDGRLFASDYMSGQGYVFDLSRPAHPKLVASFGDAGPYTHSHSFERLPNGNTLATYQFRGQPDVAPGALVELDAAGRLVRSSDAADRSVEPFIRPYSVVALPKIDRVVTTSASMLPTDKSSHVVQLWRLSDLRLLRTVVLPQPEHYGKAVANSASEARLLPDGRTVLVVTAGCGLYELDDLAGENPRAKFVYDFGYRACGVPTVVGHYWVQAATSGHSLISLDVRDASHPTEAGHLTLEPDVLPHWLAHEPNGNRIVVTGYGKLATRAIFATLDPKTGRLTLGPHRIDFDRQWPDGWKGPAMPHASLFSN